MKLLNITECQNNTYGLECTEICGKCMHGEQCHHVNGSCLNGCDVGVFGDKCDTGKISHGLRSYELNFRHKQIRSILCGCTICDKKGNKSMFYYIRSLFSL